MGAKNLINGIRKRLGIYDVLLERRVKKGKTPEHIALVINETDILGESGPERGIETLDRFLDWCDELEIDKVSIHISVLEPSDPVISEMKMKLEGIENEIDVRGPDDGHEDSSSRVASIGIGGRTEFVDALREIGERVEGGELDASEVDEETVEDSLIFEGEPDIVLKTGGEHLSDFMIWQSVYSELYFADYNWQNFRKRDFLRSIRDFQDRERRFGR